MSASDYEQVLLGLPAAVIVLDPTGVIRLWSDGAADLLGYRGAEAVGASASTLLIPTRDRAASRRARDGLRSGLAHDGQWTMRHKDGRDVAVSIAVRPIIDVAGAVVALAGMAAATEHDETDRALRASEARFRAIAETAQEGIWATSPAGVTAFANQKLADILGVTLDEIYATSAFSLLAPRDPSGFAGRLRMWAERGAEVYEHAYAHPDGGERLLRISARPLQGDEETAGWLATVTDLTETRRVESELLRRAVHDDLTGLPNRTLLMDRLDQALARQSRDPSHPVAVLFVDLDHFKLVNDSWGHSAGDALLLQVAERIRGALRPGDTVSRFGGDEFVVVCEGVAEDGADEISRRILATLAERFDVAGQSVYAGASIGVALSGAGTGIVPTSEELLRFADAAMYDAKSRGRGRSQVFDSTLADRASDRLVLGHDLRDALEADGLDMHYQPIVDLQTGALLGVEALARWHHPVRGDVPPTQLVDVAAATGLSSALDAWAVRRGSADVQVLHERLQLPIPVAVNVSAANFADPDTDNALVRVLASLRVPPGVLSLEITENALMEQPVRAREMLRELADRGIESAIDDFGTGYSSLAYLNHLPVRALKIDRTFIAALTDDDDAFAIVAAVVDLARTLGLHTVAEGIESREQLAMLRTLGCTAGQGFLWSPAVAVDALVDLVSAQSATFDVTGVTEEHRATARRRPRQAVTADHGLHQIMRLHREGASLSTIAAALNADGFRTPQGLRWHRATVARVISDLAYPQLSPRE